jgi:hypothetical protein
LPSAGAGPAQAWQDQVTVRALAAFFKANPQALILLIICVVLGLGTFIAVLFGVASSGSTTTNGYSSGIVLSVLGP